LIAEGLLTEVGEGSDFELSRAVRTPPPIMEWRTDYYRPDVLQRRLSPTAAVFPVSSRRPAV